MTTEGRAAEGIGASSGRWGRTLQALLWALCIGWAGASATLLHTASSRTDAAWVAAVAFAWGATALFSAFLARKSLAPIAVVLGVALLVRGPLIGAPPLLSDDVYRYLWEGLVLLSGDNPFTSPPVALPGLDDALRAQVNHGEISSAYPPLALAWFVVLRITGLGVPGAQVWTVLADLAVLGALLYGRKGSWVSLLYALPPLPVIESAVGAHIDVPAVACLAWACVLAERRSWLAPLLGVLGGGFKLFPALILPSLSWRAGPARAALGIGLGVVVVGLAAIPVLSAGSALFAGLGAYATHWEFNGLVFTPLTWVLHPPDARRILIPLGGLAVLVAAVVFRDRPARAWLLVGAAFVAFSPTVHPWYGLWVLVPALLVGRWSGAAVGVSLLGAYGVLSGYDAATGAWSEPAWLWAVTWLPGLAAVGVEFWLEARKRARVSARV